MTLFGRDMSDFDTNENLSGLSFLTHKATEGTSIKHAKLPSRLVAGRNAGISVLGAYHVVRTPGNGGHGSVAAQVAYYLADLDARVPWWRSWPYWMHQIDLEIWPYDAVSAATGRAFALALIRADPGRCILTYASRGMYGGTLAAWPTALWNASYGNNTGAYPGDGWASGWSPYSGQTPVLLQYCSKPYDMNAFRGTLSELKALIGGGGDDDMTPEEHAMLQGIRDAIFYGGSDIGTTPVGYQDNSLKSKLDALLSAAKTPAPVALSGEDRAAIVAALAGAVPTAAQIAQAVLDAEAARLES